MTRFPTHAHLKTLVCMSLWTLSIFSVYCGYSAQFNMYLLSYYWKTGVENYIQKKICLPSRCSQMSGKNNRKKERNEKLMVKLQYTVGSHWFNFQSYGIGRRIENEKTSSSGVGKGREEKNTEFMPEGWKIVYKVSEMVVLTDISWRNKRFNLPLNPLSCSPISREMTGYCI